MHLWIYKMFFDVFLQIHAFFICNARLKLTKNQANAKQHSEAELLIFEIYCSHSPSTLTSKIVRHIKNKQRNKYVCVHEIIWVIIMKIKMKSNKRSHRYDIHRTRSIHGHKYRKYKKYFCMMILICIKQHLSKIWSLIHEKVKGHWDWVEKICWL